MPAATTTVVPDPPQGQVWYRPSGDRVMEPFSSSITAAEHKIRNLEKRKVKLDQYRNEQAEGKTLNADQLGAVAKYSEVVQQLEFNRELVSALRHVHQHTIKFIKNELKRDISERNKFTLALQAVLYQLENPNIQHDILLGNHGAPKIAREDLDELVDLAKTLRPSLGEQDFSSKLEVGAETVSKLFEGRGKINNKPSQQVKSLIDTLVESQYFKSGLAPSSVPIETPEEEEDVVQQPHANSNPVNVSQPPEQQPITMNSNPVSAQLLMKQDREMAYGVSFIQESQLEIESPHMDPAVVAVSAFAPPPPQQLQQVTENNHVYPTPQQNNVESLNNIQPGIRDLNLNHANSNNMDEEEEWKEDGNFPNNSNGNVEGEQDNMNGERGSRNNFRGRGNGRARGGPRGNGYGNGRGMRGNSKGYTNHRGGGGGNYFRADRIGQSDAETADYRGGKNGRHSRPYRGSSGNGPQMGNAMPSQHRRPQRGGPGAPRPYNGVHEPRNE